MSLTGVVKMSSAQKIPKAIEESEMEEGEIVDELDDLSDISSEEEFLLRQRLEVLENYNNVLERKKAKRSSLRPGTKPKRDVVCDQSRISAAELEHRHTHVTYKQLKVQRHVKPHNRLRRRKDAEQYHDENNVRKKKDNQRKKSTRSKKRLGVKVISESSDESEDEYRNKRKKLANAVIVPRGKGDKSSLSARLHKMIHGSEAHIGSIDIENKDTEVITDHQNIVIEEALSPISSISADIPPVSVDVPDGLLKDRNICELIELSTDDDVKIISNVVSQDQTEKHDMAKIEDCKRNCEKHNEKDSDEDLELLRQHALESKHAKPKTPERESDKTDQKLLSEDEDSDTAELRLICLKSALLKKAIEMKQKQKLQKKLSQSSNLDDDLFDDQNLFQSKVDSANNTDIESVDMDMGSDTEERNKECNGENYKINNAGGETVRHDSDKNTDLINHVINNPKEDELDDDEDLLRAKLLTSLSKNLTNLVSPEILKSINEVKQTENATPQTVTNPVKLPETKKFIIKLDESDSEGEHEATKNLTKMHMKLSDQIDFQQKLDIFLKSTRMEVEKTELPDVVQKPSVPKKPNKFVAKAVNHLPKSEQIEYKNLVRRMAELEKMKQTRQATINLMKQPMKNALQQRNVTIDAQADINFNLEEQIARSRKIIAEESTKMLKLKEEATKLIQRHKIAAAELRNITTAITLNKKQQRAVQNSLSKIRSQHQSLLKSSTTSMHSKVNNRIPHLSSLSNKVLSNKLKKENYPKDEYKNLQAQKTVKVSVVNDFVDEANINHPRLSVQIDVANNKKIVKIPELTDQAAEKIDEDKQSFVNKDEQKLEEQERRLSGNNNDANCPEKEKGDKNTDNAESVAVYDHGNKRFYISAEDYKSPLDALGSNTWQADPNAILCPFEVGGQCKDPDCKYLHTPTLEQ